MAEKTKEKEPKKPSRWWRRVKVALALLVVGGSIVGLAFGFAFLDREVREQPVYQMTAESLRLVDGPSWVTPAILADLDVRDRLPERFSLLDPSICERVARAYEQVVWVERVSRVVKLDPRADPSRSPLEVTLKFRRPVAYVQGAQGYYLVDGKGVRLPGVYSDVPGLGNATLLLINGVDTPPPDPGHPWFDPSLEAGVAVADVVEPYREKYRVTRIDVANVGGRRNKGDSEILLFTRSIPPTRIKWGKAPSPEAEILQEKTLAQKVSYLNYVYEKLGGRVDGVLDYIDVPNEIICRRTSQLTTNDRPPR